MLRPCTICSHDEGHAINVALVSREAYRDIAVRYGVSKTALQRHSREHLPKLMVQSSKAVEVADADGILEQVKSLQRRTMAILDEAEEEGADSRRDALAAIREARENLRLLGNLAGELQEGTQINVFTNPQWIKIERVMLDTLSGFPEAFDAVSNALLELHDSEASDVGH